MRPHKAAIAAQEIKQFAKIDGHTQGTRRVEQIGHVYKDAYALGRWERRKRNRNVRWRLVGVP